tara:strand:- start:447 stop:839 length:393 start_codon:yes stop_codon:yes gene_type:complete
MIDFLSKKFISILNIYITYMIFKLYKTTYLDKFNKCYKNIISINKNPNDPSLNNVLKLVSRQKLSPFEGFDCCTNQPSCLVAFIDPNTKEFLTDENIDQVFSILLDNGYTLEYEMTKLIKDVKLVCLISK